MQRFTHYPSFTDPRLRKALQASERVWVMFRQTLTQQPIVGYVTRRDPNSPWHVYVYVAAQNKTYSVALDGSIQATGSYDKAQMEQWFTEERL